jgi:3-hydroxyacyl-CoA dehydrogenase
LVASAESYMGLVEVGVGLIPAGGGTKEMLLRGMDGAPDDAIALPFLKKIFQTIAMAKVSTSADEARTLGFIRSSDRIVLNGDHQIHYAKQAAIGLAESGYRQPRPRTDIPVMGLPGMETVKLLVGGMKEGGYISDHDEVVSLKLAGILTGGHLSSPQKVSEDYLLDLEREAFLSLCGMRKTQERIKHMLEKGKPLRN